MNLFIIPLLLFADDETITINGDYKGKACKDSRAKLLIESVSSDVKDALCQIKECIGFSQKPGIKIHIDFADDTSIDNARAATICDGKSVNIIFAVPKMIEDGLKREYIETFRHELTHAVIRTHMPEDDAYIKLPTWLRESVSVLVAGEKYRWTHVAYIKTKGVLTSHFDGLEKGDYNSWDMLEGYLALEYIDKKAGNEKLKKFLSLVFKENIDFKEAVKSIVDMNYDKFVDEAQKYAKTYAKKIDGKGAYPENEGNWISKFIDKELTLKSNFVIEDTIEIKDKVRPETIRIWIVGNDNWIHGDIHAEVLKSSEKEGVFYVDIKIDMSKFSDKPGVYYIWYMVHDKDDYMKRLRLKIKI